MTTGELDIVQIMLDSGLVVKTVLLSLILASVVSWAIILKKKKLIKELEENSRDFLEVYKNSTSLKDIMESCHRLSLSPHKSLFTNGYLELSKLKDALGDDKEKLEQHITKHGLQFLERGMKKGVHEINIELERFLATLASIGSVTPFVGLFGTVWGIIGSFTGLAGGGATLDAVAPGIAEALVATAVGLVAAIPAVWFYNKFNNENSHIQSEMESFGQEFLNVVERSLVK
ncbi:TolQ protein [Halobacteriovorax marinus SJ]|uniref:TolQ protein n=1 Tax=Halobacteriovorax marinus (strain ATCC BAA-682 / DSM 15412 / SJ) TaxID=862908 RepID=E1WXJ5_HALMS|nr:MotA/TolQ/ExbB proton channel family protein [Halobacteriovorax marinus]CBW27512.1 TolQ protein [Halobacteriovorax marinus SJ]